MPPEPFPWDRRDFRKHDRSAPDARAAAGGLDRSGSHKWRNQQHHAPLPYHQQHQQQQRWYSDFRSPRLLPTDADSLSLCLSSFAEGQSKQGDWPMYSDDAGQGFRPSGSRYDRNLEDENCQPFASRGNGNGRNFRNNRGNRGSFTRKDWKGPSWKPAAVQNFPGEMITEVNNLRSKPAAVPNSPGEMITEVNNLRSIENTQPCHNRSSRSSYDAHTPLGSVSLSDQSQTQSLVKENNDSTADETIGKGQESEKENCLGPVEWKALKWNRVSSLFSRSSCMSHCTSSKSLGQDSEVLAEVQPKNATLDHSPSVDVSCVRLNARAQSEETGSRKKPRLGWGEGLAKFEKKKVEVPGDVITKHEPDLGAIGAESPLSQSVNLLEKSPRVESLLECASPATPSSVACSSSPGVLEENSVKEANFDCDATNVSCSPSIASAHYGGSTINLQNLELESITNLSSLINELLQPNDPCSAENGDIHRMSMNKLLVWKVDVLRALEMTESEIESLDTELKSLIVEPGLCCSQPAGPRSQAGELQLRPCGVLDTASRNGVRFDSLNVSSKEIIVSDAPLVVEVGQVLSKDEDIDSPGSATSKFVDVRPVIFPSEKADFSEGAGNVDLDKSVNNHVLIGNTSRQDLVSISKVYCNVSNICGSILTSNRDAASRALELLNKLLPKQCIFNGSVESIVSSLPKNSSVVKERFLKRKQFLQFKEKVLALKFKVFQHFWKEGRLVSVRTLRGKTRKKFDPSRNGRKRNHSRVSSYAGGCQAVPADEVINFVNDLLSQLAFKPYRNSLKMPALILDKQVKMSRFISDNGLVRDPRTIEKERSLMNPWAAEETEIFIEKLAAFGKDFTKIASFLDHKTVADCVEFYYKNHKSKWFEESRKNSGFIKQTKAQTTTYLVSSGKRRNREYNAAASLDMLGAAASEIAAKIDISMDVQQKCPSRSSFGASRSCEASRVVDNLLKGSDSMDMDNNARETEAADVLAGICVSVSSEATSSSITSSVDLGDVYQDPSCPRTSPSMKRPLTPDSECSYESCSELNPTDWSDEEKSLFIQAVSSYGKDFVMVSQRVRTKSMDQCKVFFSKTRKCLGLDLVQPDTGTASGDVDGGGSDIEDDCNTGTSSGICNNSSDCKMKEDSSPPGMKFNQESDVVNMQPNFKTSKGNELGPLDSTTNELVLENSSVLGGHGDDKPVTNLNYHTEGQNGTGVSFLSVQDPQTVAVASNTMFERRIKEEDDLGMPDEVEGILSNIDAEVNVTSSGISSTKVNPQLAGNVSHASVDAHSSTQTDQKSNDLKMVDIGTCSAEKSCISSLLPIGRLASVSSSTLSPVTIKYKKTPNLNTLMPVKASGIDGRHSQKIASTGNCQQNLPSYSLSNSTESSQILEGYPVSLQTKKKTNGDVSSARLNVPDENLNADCRADFLLRKCKEARQSNVLFPPLQRGSDCSRTQSGCSSAGEDPPRNGDVKLFGKILSSSLQKPNKSVDDDHRTCLESLNPKLSSHQKLSLDFAQPKFDRNNYVSTENMRVGRFGFWDGSKMQTGTPPIPDSAILLAKYPSAFSNFSLPSLHGTVKSRESPADGGPSVSQSRELSNGLRNRELQQDDMLAEMQRRNTFNAASGMRGMSGIHVGGRGRMSFGGEYCSLTDPVAAIQMHYAKAEQLRKQGDNAVKEEDKWISSRDVGR